MCVAGKEEAVPPLTWFLGHSNHARVVKPKVLRSMIPSSRVNLNQYWEKLDTINGFSGFVNSSWRKRVSNFTSCPGNGQLQIGETLDQQFIDKGLLTGFNQTGRP